MTPNIVFKSIGLLDNAFEFLFLEGLFIGGPFEIFTLLNRPLIICWGIIMNSFKYDQTIRSILFGK
jgi:hypothetical protein